MLRNRKDTNTAPHCQQNQQNMENWPGGCHKQEVGAISGWDHQPVLMEHNPNVFHTRKSKQSKDKDAVFMRLTAALGERVESRDRERASLGAIGRRRASGTVPNREGWQTQGNQNVDPFKFRDTDMYGLTHSKNQSIQCSFSNIEILKFQAQHLQKEESCNDRFPTFGCHNTSQILSGYSSQNPTKLQSKFTRSRQQTRQIRREFISTHSHSSSTHANNSCKFYKTLTSEWLTSKSPNLIIEPTSSHMYCQYQHNQSQQCEQSRLYSSMGKGKQARENREPEVMEFSGVVGTNLINGTQANIRAQFKTIHWKKNRPFTKFFQGKKKKAPEHNGNAVPIHINNKGKAIKQLEGRKLYQLLTLNRVIELQDL